MASFAPGPDFHGSIAPLVDREDGAWDAGAGSRASPLLEVDAAVHDELKRNRAMLQQPIPPEGRHADSSGWNALHSLADRVRLKHLDRGFGFVVVRGFSTPDYSTLEIENIFWRLCTILGEPMVQKGGGVRYGRVADLGLPPQARPRYHETGIGGSIHTDSPIMAKVADLVGLLCLNAAREGGESKFVSIATVHDIMLRNAPALLAELYRPFCFDRRIDPADVSPDNPSVLRAPIFSFESELGVLGLRLRWQPEYVWQAPQLPGVPQLGERQRLALHLLEAVLEDRAEAITIRLAMQRGDMQFLNNHRVAHGRTAFSDDARAGAGAASGATARREMRRVWLRRA